MKDTVPRRCPPGPDRVPLGGGVPGPLHLSLHPHTFPWLRRSESRWGKTVPSWEGPGELAEASHASYKAAKVPIAMEIWGVVSMDQHQADGFPSQAVPVSLPRRPVSSGTIPGTAPQIQSSVTHRPRAVLASCLSETGQEHKVNKRQLWAVHGALSQTAQRVSQAHPAGLTFRSIFISKSNVMWPLDEAVSLVRCHLKITTAASHTNTSHFG